MIIAENRKQVLGHVLACGTQIMWGATFVSTKVLLRYFMPVEVLFTRAVLAVLTLYLLYPHHLKLREKKQEFAFAGAGLFGIVLYFMLENTALTLTYASNVGIIVACAPFFVAVVVGFFFKSEKPDKLFFVGFVIAITGVAMISLGGQKTVGMNPIGDGLAFLAMVSWGFYSAVVKKIGEWEYPMIAVTRRIYIYAIVFLVPVLWWNHASWDVNVLIKPEVLLNFLFLGVGASAMGFFVWNLSTQWIGALKTSVYIYVSPIVTVVLSLLILKERLTVRSVIGAVLILTGLVISQRRSKASNMK